MLTHRRPKIKRRFAMTKGMTEGVTDRLILLECDNRNSFVILILLL